MKSKKEILNKYKKDLSISSKSNSTITSQSRRSGQSNQSDSPKKERYDSSSEEKDLKLKESNTHKSHKSLTLDERKQQKTDLLKNFNQDNLNIWSRGVKQLEDNLNPVSIKDKICKIDDPLQKMIANKLAEEKTTNKKYKFTLGLKSKFSRVENRFDIDPGYMWDGIERGNGYEYKYIAAVNENADKKHSNFKFRIEEM